MSRLLLASFLLAMVLVVSGDECPLIDLRCEVNCEPLCPSPLWYPIGNCTKTNCGPVSGSLSNPCPCGKGTARNIETNKCVPVEDCPKLQT
ncbi:hypothetical protein K0M31_009344 [Melipona bicolor]|uniref:TIL domain-containing protein n=1 Tax=Melipona bicolor TaxID=60889 RepID=A0AA40FQ07_9HYME|nr:hypothetical protein K0M31_009344 [Melipona bicolor]